jgi:peptide/nickel transport system permease protein
MRWQDYLSAEIPRSLAQARVQRMWAALSVFARNRLALFGAVLVALIVLAALLAPWLAAQPPDAQDLAARLVPPGGAHLFGTDELGRDVYSRILYGARISLGMVAVVVILVGPAGLVIGCTAGYFGGWVDLVLTRLTDVFLAFPRLILALALVVAIGPGIAGAIIAIALTAWPPYARVARAEALALRGADFVSAARLQGAPPWRIVWRQIMPLCVTSTSVRLTLDMAGIIVTAAGLGFLGLGAQPPSPEWGAMIASGRRFFLDQWWVAFFPGTAIALSALGFDLLGDGLRDVLDVRGR